MCDSHGSMHACRLNNPEAHTFCDNCNVLLTAAMDKAGLSEYCDASEEVRLSFRLLHGLAPPNLPSTAGSCIACGYCYTATAHALSSCDVLRLRLCPFSVPLPITATMGNVSLPLCVLCSAKHGHD